MPSSLIMDRASAAAVDALPAASGPMTRSNLYRFPSTTKPCALICDTAYLRPSTAGASNSESAPVSLKIAPSLTTPVEPDEPVEPALLELDEHAARSATAAISARPGNDLLKAARGPRRGRKPDK